MDKYSKAILTVIAAQLFVLIFQNFGVGKATAEQPRLQKIQICGYSSSSDQQYNLGQNCVDVINGQLRVGNQRL